MTRLQARPVAHLADLKHGHRRLEGNLDRKRKDWIGKDVQRVFVMRAGVCVKLCMCNVISVVENLDKDVTEILFFYVDVLYEDQGETRRFSLLNP